MYNFSNDRHPTDRCYFKKAFYNQVSLISKTLVYYPLVFSEMEGDSVSLHSMSRNHSIREHA